MILYAYHVIRFKLMANSYFDVIAVLSNQIKLYLFLQNITLKKKR